VVQENLGGGGRVKTDDREPENEKGGRVPEKKTKSAFENQDFLIGEIQGTRRPPGEQKNGAPSGLKNANHLRGTGKRKSQKSLWREKTYCVHWHHLWGVPLKGVTGLKRIKHQ